MQAYEALHPKALNDSAIINDGHDYERASQSAEFIWHKLNSNEPLEIAIICGSGLGSIGEQVENGFRIDYADIPHFPTPTGVIGHKGTLLIGQMCGKRVICMEGRLHAYEGHATASCAFPIKVMKLLGVRHLINSAASGGLNTAYKAGDIMIVNDHINLPGMGLSSPLIGKNDERFGSRFPAMLNIYDRDLIKLAKQACAELALTSGIHEGVYVSIGGPAFETVAEVKMLRLLGADAVGMSLVHESTFAFYLGMKVFGIAVISDIAPDSHDIEHHTTPEEVTQQAFKVTPKVIKIVKALVASI